MAWQLRVGLGWGGQIIRPVSLLLWGLIWRVRWQEGKRPVCQWTDSNNTEGHGADGQTMAGQCWGSAKPWITYFAACNALTLLPLYTLTFFLSKAGWWWTGKSHCQLLLVFSVGPYHWQVMDIRQITYKYPVNIARKTTHVFSHSCYVQQKIWNLL